MTIVELLVALSVSVIALMGLMGLFTMGSRAQAISADTAQAVDVAAQMLEELGAIPVGHLETLPGYLPIDAEGWGPEPYHLGPALGRRDIELERWVSARQVFGTPELVWLRVEVSWRDPGAADALPRRVALETVRLREETP
jgi:hypothetical protein